MKVDFAKVLDDIAYLLGDPLPGGNPDLRVPVSQEKLADHLQVARGTLRGWIDGSEPRHADGEKLLVTWSRLTGKARTFAPLERLMFSASKVEAKPTGKVDASVLSTRSSVAWPGTEAQLAAQRKGREAGADAIRKLGRLAASNKRPLDPENDPDDHGFASAMA